VKARLKQARTRGNEIGNEVSGGYPGCSDGHREVCWCDSGISSCASWLAVGPSSGRINH
jgi:hypothetical protein